MRAIKVERSAPLQGSVTIPGSKNSALALLAATCLADEPVTLHGIPEIADLRVIYELGSEIGLKFERPAKGTVIIDPRSIGGTALDPAKSSSFRAAYYFVGALLAKFGTVSVGYPGGDDFVSRPMDQHIKALKHMGASFSFFDRHYTVEAAELRGAVVYFDMITSGATINAMLAAVLAKGTTVLMNAARDPEVTDTANLLNRMGARIVGAGTDHIRIEGVKSLSGCEYTVIPDRLIAGAFLMAAGATGGTITVRDVIPEHLSSCMFKLREIGMEIEADGHSITAHAAGPLRATRVRTAMYPGFATDLQQPLTALLTQAQGKSIIGERIYPARFNHVHQLNRMGASIKVRSGVAFVHGGLPLRGSLVHASDVRAGICLILAGLCAEGTTTIAGVQHIDRGYEDAVGAFRSLGANIELHDSDEVAVGSVLQQSN
ncbi:UDP-N-acetylglucosamine 1-carboxyvinyltransferase [Paenibacillus sacheonensis]|uniref:UDP-N-acetylglucosamine 1-carboxyvinyltransferase n=1 Tax=Paenibacillus sacheonensis TaxID=742054 RepID=A0A7X4YRC2_9BACL|nr:UDP-N-acetylglucosamine 1-carboxyvinyltransferase [Paenibacillus sacheonensis]MBM7563584.1 UDP-N-acetylglucosamine 1-carboxyvinyltransferase [Paenibacillus sacheonensis]NBC71120.1 UDP-N-acetylglucosamine 1-carboxyvinyltransferase [Paenibacillus sacheonensis]